MNITSATKVYGVIGDPVSHSLSPVMHNGWIADHGLDAVYVALRLRSEDAAANIRALKQFGFAGLNVTVPHKAAAAQAADRCESEAANTLRWEADGALSAFNTDGAGFIDALTEVAPQWRERTKSILVIGAGGAAQGIVQALAGLTNITIVNRTYPRAALLAEHFPRCGAAMWEALPALFSDVDLIINTTTLGMDKTESPTWPIVHCLRGTIVVDIVYRPLETPLLRAAREQGLVTVDGLGMLIHQGARAFELWFGVKPDAAKARARLMAALVA